MSSSTGRIRCFQRRPKSMIRWISDYKHPGRTVPCSVHMSLILLLALLLPDRTAHAYADWLKCYVDFDDQDEAIMHRPLVPAEDQPDERRAYLEIKPYASKVPWIVSARTDYQDLFPSNATDADTRLLKLRLRVPPSLSEKKVQFVVQVTGEGVSFVGKNVMCGGNRAFSKKHTSHVLLQMNSTLLSESDATKEHLDPSSELFRSIELVAGWAAGYEAVKITPKMLLVNRRRFESDDTSGSPLENGGGRGQEL